MRKRIVERGLIWARSVTRREMRSVALRWRQSRDWKAGVVAMALRDFNHGIQRLLLVIKNIP